jgi:hypothetical protein
MRKSDRERTIFTTHSTTNSPQKHHVPHTLFSKTPCKIHPPPRQRKKSRARKKRPGKKPGRCLKIRDLRVDPGQFPYTAA